MTALAFPSPARSRDPLLDAYDGAAPFYFSSRAGSTLARGAFTEVACESDRNAVDRAGLSAVLPSYRGVPLVGAVPFDPRQRPRLLLPASLEFGGSVADPGASRSSERVPCSPPAFELRSPLDESRAQFQRAVAKALREIEAGRIDKVVLARTLAVRCRGDEGTVDLVVRRLLQENAGCYGFALRLRSQDDDPPKTFFGASPELLLSKRGQQVSSHPLAGSAARTSDPDRDRQIGQRLLESEKNRREHAFVVADVASRLAPLCRTLRVPKAPSLVRTGTMWHLGSRIEGELLDGQRSALELALRLHPTPAVCGVPRAAAHALIDSLESEPRGFYTGLVGWNDASGDGDWAVAIRCALGSAAGFQLYAGAGIVQGSTPGAEWAETTAKLQTLLAALGLGGDRSGDE